MSMANVVERLTKQYNDAVERAETAEEKLAESERVRKLFADAAETIFEYMVSAEIDGYRAQHNGGTKLYEALAAHQGPEEKP